MSETNEVIDPDANADDVVHSLQALRRFAKPRAMARERCELCSSHWRGFSGGAVTDEEKREMRGVDPHARTLLERTESMNGAFLRAGDSVRIRPRNRADAMDMILAGKTALIEAVEEDAEGKVHFAPVIEDDPGRESGMMRQPGHRFFYGADEVEPLKERETA